MMFRRTGLFLLIGVLCIFCNEVGHAQEQIPCWQAQAVMAWALGNEAKAEKIARKYYSKAQIAEARKRCNI